MMSRRRVVWTVTLCASALGFHALAAPSTDVAALPTLAPLVESVRSAVVNVDVQQRGQSTTSNDDFFERFFGDGTGTTPAPRSPVREGAGSGFVVDSTGLVLTNHHVVDGAIAIKVTFDDGREFDAQVLGMDAATDIALLKIKGKTPPLPAVKLGDSDALKVGDWVLAIGNPYGLASSVSAGIVSAKARNIQRGAYDDFLQTDAAINPGNSGGPLFNLRGEVVGINSALVSGSTGIGFAVPVNLVKALLPQLQKQGRVTRAYLGIQVEDVPPDVARALKVPSTDGALVVRAEEGSPCAKAGVRGDDVIVALDGQRVVSAASLLRSVALKPPGSASALTLYRGAQKLELKVALATRPESERGPPSVSAPSGDSRRVGLQFRDADPHPSADPGGVGERGALVVEVAPGTPAQRAGLSVGMVVVSCDNRRIVGAADLAEALRRGKAGMPLLLRVQIPNVPGRHLRALTLP